MSPLPRAAEVRPRTGVLASLPPGAGVAVVRLRSLGDTVLTTPALAALKAWRPDLRVAVLVEPRFAAVLEGNPDINQIIPVGSSLSARIAALRRVRRFRPALIAGLHGGSTAAWLSRCSGAPVRATFLGLRHVWAYNRLTPPKTAADSPGGGRKLHTAEHIASLFEALGMPETALGPARVFPSPPALDAMRARLRAAGVAGRFAFLNLDAREPGMRWPRERFTQLAARLRARRGWSSVGASPDPGAPGCDGITLLAGTTVAELVALLAQSEMLIGNDGGPVHIAAALAKPVVGLYSTTDLPVWSPWQTRSRLLQDNDLARISVEAIEAAAAALVPSGRDERHDA